MKTKISIVLLLSHILPLTSQASHIPTILTEEIYDQLVAGTHPTIELAEDGKIFQIFYERAGVFHWDKGTKENLVMERRLFIKPGMPVRDGQLVYQATTRPDTVIFFDYKMR
ncbi:MAG: hypothetical protein H2057_04625 [Alphaproteobacteria bacterium]|nr:hypothetical protein [Alphaproteobacteria bacterium]